MPFSDNWWYNTGENSRQVTRHTRALRLGKRNVCSIVIATLRRRVVRELMMLEGEPPEAQGV